MAHSNALIFDDGYASSEQKFILWFFYLLAGFALLVVSLLFTVKINDTVEFTEGEIISTDPEVAIKAPFEAQLSKVLVKEGQGVNTGDTLMEILNEANNRELSRQIAEKNYLENKLVSIGNLLGAVVEKKDEVGIENKLNHLNHNLNTQDIANDIHTLDEQYRLEQQKLNTALERSRADSILYQKDMLSKLEYNAGRDAVNTIRESMNITQRGIERQRTLKNAGANDLMEKQHHLKLKTIELEENHQGLHQLRIALINDLVKTNETIAQLNKEIAKQYLIASTRGTVNFIYNAKQSSNLINKGDLLLRISPAAASFFYAKAILPQNNIQYLKTTMPAQLKLDAYYHLEYGIIRGSVTYISERKENDKFYALISLNNTQHFNLKSGYNVSGEIITGRMVLLQYLLKKLFKAFDKKPS